MFKKMLLTAVMTMGLYAGGCCSIYCYYTFIGNSLVWFCEEITIDDCSFLPQG